MPFFSIIIPVYNVEAYLDKCIKSILCQTFKDFEIILIDDGSTDASGEICDRYDNHKNIKVFHQKNHGSSSARNKGLEIAKGKFVIFIDSDDYWINSNGLQLISERIHQYNNDVVLFREKEVYIYNKNKEYVHKPFDLDMFVGRSKLSILTYLYSSQTFPGATWIFAVKRSLIIENNMRFPEGVSAEDIGWINNILINCSSLGAINEVIYAYVQDRNGKITGSPKLSGVQGSVLAMKEWLSSDKLELCLPITMRMAHLYWVQVLAYAALNKSDRKMIREEVKNCSKILNYSGLKKDKFLKYFLKIFGFYYTGKLLFIGFKFRR